MSDVKHGDIPSTTTTASGSVIKSDTQEKDRWHIMLNWLSKAGAKFPDLKLEFYSHDYRGVHAAKDVASEVVILYVPYTHLMTTEVAKESEIGQRIHNTGCTLRSSHSYLACYLLQEKHNPKSFWKPYIDCLPRDYRNMPPLFDNEELKWLKGSFSLEKIDDRLDDLRREFDNLSTHIPEFPKKYTLEEFTWARMAVITRIFGLTIRNKSTDGLVPLADMLNHRRPNTGTTWTFDDSVNGFTITTTSAVKQGDQIYDSYGRKCNSRFFVNYGFSLEENEDNQVVLTLELPESDPLFKQKHRQLGGFRGAQRKKFQIPIDYREKVTKEAYAFARFCHASDKEFTGAVASYALNVSIKELDQISLRNEVAVVRMMATEARRVLAGFDTSLEEDNKLLVDPNQKLTMNIRNAVLMRRGEKEVLHYYIDLEKEVLQLVDRPWDQIKTYAAQLHDNKLRGPFDFYIVSVIVPLLKAEKDKVVDLIGGYLHTNGTDKENKEGKLPFSPKDV